MDLVYLLPSIWFFKASCWGVGIHIGVRSRNNIIGKVDSTSIEARFSYGPFDLNVSVSIHDLMKYLV